MAVILAKGDVEALGATEPGDWALLHADSAKLVNRTRCLSFTMCILSSLIAFEKPHRVRPEQLGFGDRSGAVRCKFLGPKLAWSVEGAVCALSVNERDWSGTGVSTPSAFWEAKPTGKKSEERSSPFCAPRPGEGLDAAWSGRCVGGPELPGGFGFIMLLRRPCLLFFVSSFTLASAACSSAGPVAQGTSGDAQNENSTQMDLDTREDANVPSQSSGSTMPKPGWGKATEIGKAINEFGAEMSPPVIAMNEKGQAIAAWSSWSEEADPISPHLHLSMLQAHAWKSLPALLDHYARDAQVAINARGDIVVGYARVIHQPSGQGWKEEAWVLRYVNGAWQKPERIGFESPTDGIEATYIAALQIKLSATGEALMVWRQSDTRRPAQHEGLFASYLSGGRWSAPVKLDARMPAFVDTFATDLNASGQGQVLWLDRVQGTAGDPKDQAERSVLWSRSIAKGVWGKASPLSKSALTDAVVHRSPRILVDEAGQGHALYLEGQAGQVIMSKVLYARSGAPGQSWGQAQPLYEGASTSLSLETGIAASASGVLAAAWRADSRLHPQYSSAFLRVFDPGTAKWEPALELATHASGVQSAPRLHVDGKGRVWAAWRQSDADPKASIHARTFALGQGLGELHRPAHGESLQLAGNARGQLCLVARHHYVSQNPLGYVSAPTATVYLPE